MPEYRIKPLFTKQACACPGVCRLYEEMHRTHRARLVVLDDPSVRDQPMEIEWIYTRSYKSNADLLGHADRAARVAYFDHVVAQVEGREPVPEDVWRKRPKRREPRKPDIEALAA